jgi:hypothetical protein
MLTVGVQIVRFTDAAQPGWVECVLRDAQGRTWVFSDKVPIFTSVSLDADSSYPQPGVIACEIVRECIDENGRKRCIVNTARPWGVAAKSGEMQFEVFYEQVNLEAE